MAITIIVVITVQAGSDTGDSSDNRASVVDKQTQNKTGVQRTGWAWGSGEGSNRMFAQ